jgi:hypothetical protein
MLKKNARKEPSHVPFSIGALETSDRRGKKGITTSEPSLK